MENLDKVVYITGGTKGIGLGIAKELLKAGYRVAISGRDRESVKQGLLELGSTKERVLGIISDVRNPEDELYAANKIQRVFGRLDALVANAGMGRFKPVDQLEIEDWQQMIDTNLSGLFYSLRACLPLLKESKGYFFSIASLAGANFFENGSGYNASKFGAVGFTQAAMLDLRQYDIKVTTIMPGTVSSEFNGNVPGPKDAWKIQPEDIGQLVLDCLKMPARSLPSKIEIRPTRPDQKG